MKNFLLFSMCQLMQFIPLFSEIELGIVLLPEEPIRNEVDRMNHFLFTEFQKEGITIKQLPNISHISIFQMNLDEKNLPILEKKVADVAKQYSKLSLFLVPFLRNTHENIFWDIAKNSERYAELEKLLQDIIRKVGHLRHKKPMRQLRNIKLTAEEKDLIKKYGVPFGVPENFNPHITVYYDTGDRQIVDDVLKKVSICRKQFICNKLGLVQLGYNGNVEKILKCFELKN